MLPGNCLQQVPVSSVIDADFPWNQRLLSSQTVVFTGVHACMHMPHSQSQYYLRYWLGRACEQMNERE